MNAAHQGRSGVEGFIKQGVNLCTFEDLAEYLNTDQPDKGAIERTARHFDLYRHRVSKPLVNKGIPGRESLTEWVS